MKAIRTALQKTYRDNSGTVLVLVLWVLAMLTVIAGYYAVEARIRRNIGQSAWNELQGREAVFSMLRLLSIKTAPPGATRDQEEENAMLEGDVRIYPDGLPYIVKFGDLDLKFALQDESGKIDINQATEEQLQALFASITGDDEQKAIALAECLLDWRDKDNIERPDGAEDPYYTSLVPPYQAADRPFLLLSELLLVKGFDLNLFYGPISWTSEEDAETSDEEDIEPTWTGSLIDLLTVYNSTSGVNTSYAAPPLQELQEGATRGGARPGKVFCLKMKWQASNYVVYWGKAGPRRFGIIHWSQHGSLGTNLKQ